MPDQTINPATGELVQSFPEIGDDALAAAVDAAQAAYETDWRHRAIANRAAIVSLAAKRLRDNSEEYAGYVTLELDPVLKVMKRVAVCGLGERHDGA